MDIQGRRRSNNFEDRGRGAGGGRGGGLPVQALLGVFKLIGPKGAIGLIVLCGIGYFVLPAELKQQLFGALTGDAGATRGAPGAGSACTTSPANDQACDFSRVVLASTEDVWTAQFQGSRLPSYSGQPGAYVQPTLVVFEQSVTTGGCGNATSAVGPFYCPGDQKLYIDPEFYGVMKDKLKAPGDFAQAYVIAHEVGHHVQNLIGATSQRARGDSENQTSVRVELQADCFAGVWGHTARGSLAITDEDLKEAVNAAHAIGDDTLGSANADDYTHGTSAQRMRWFRRGFDSGQPKECDTFQVAKYSEL